MRGGGACDEPVPKRITTSFESRMLSLKPLLTFRELLAASVVILGLAIAPAWSQLPTATEGPTTDGATLDSVASGPVDSSLLAEQALADPVQPEVADPVQAPVLELLLKGGWLMVPIAIMSLLVVAVAVERALGLRRARHMPGHLVRGLRQLADVGDFEPRTAYRICCEYPSTLARVVVAMLSKSGRPHAEVEAASAEAIQNEADQMYANVRTLNLASAVTPLMGLLGTVWGMIVAFNVTASLPAGSNKGPALAEGIYFALVTTFAGLAVAIPAAMLAHYFEGRILRITRRMEGLMAELMPRMEQLEGGQRMSLAELQASARASQPAGEALPEWSPSPAHGNPTHSGLAGPHEAPTGPPAASPTQLQSEQPWQG